MPSEDVDLHINMNLFRLATTSEERKYYSEQIAKESMVCVYLFLGVLILHVHACDIKIFLFQHPVLVWSSCIEK